jgi:PD-(D/E)XK nuclease superfamily
MADTPQSFNEQAQAIANQPMPTVAKTRRDAPTGRTYHIDGEIYPSVTNILGAIGKPALINWAAKTERNLVSEAAADLYLDLVKCPPMSRIAYLTTLEQRIGKEKAHKRELEKASEIGTQAHSIIEWNIRKALGQKVGPEPKLVDDALWAFMSFQDWAKSVSLKPMLIEQVVFSKTHRYAGTMDLLAEVDGETTLVDFKTGKAIYGEAHLQNAAYQVALSEMGHGIIRKGLILRLPKVQTDPEFEVSDVSDSEELFPVFLAVYELWTWQQKQDAIWREKRATR